MNRSNVVYLLHPMVDKRSNIPNRVREHRKGAGKTLADLADETNISVPMIGAIERGSRKLHLDHARILAEALGVSPADLLGAEDHSFVTTQDERALIDHYRQLDAQGRRAVRGVAENLSSFRAEPGVVDTKDHRRTG